MLANELMSFEECYRILDISPGATPQEIKRAYYKKAKVYHPDINNSSDAKSQFILINEAYELLINGNSYTARDAYRSASYDYYHQPETRQERAARFARMRYEEFKKNNEEFKSSVFYIPVKIFTYFILLFGAVVACVFMIGPPLYLYFDRAVGITMLPVVGMGIAIMFGVFKFNKEIKRYF